jgi:hypothetical protein
MSAIVIGDDTRAGGDPRTHERRPGGGGVVRAVAMTAGRWGDTATVSPCCHAGEPGARTTSILHDIEAAA